jgi:hypothetical protein
MGAGGQLNGHAQIDAPQQPWSLSEAAVTHWLDNARPGETIAYGRGASPSALKSDGVKAMQEAFDEGRVTFKSRRHGEGDYSFFAERRDDPRRPPATQRITRRAVSDDDDEVAMLMATLRSRAHRLRPMGTNRDLAEAIGASGPDRVAYLLRKLISADRIKVEAFGIGVRVCTIKATGKKTARIAG